MVSALFFSWMELCTDCGFYRPQFSAVLGIWGKVVAIQGHVLPPATCRYEASDVFAELLDGSNLQPSCRLLLPCWGSQTLILSTFVEVWKARGLLYNLGCFCYPPKNCIAFRDERLTWWPGFQSAWPFGYATCIFHTLLEWLQAQHQLQCHSAEEQTDYWLQPRLSNPASEGIGTAHIGSISFDNHVWALM